MERNPNESFEDYKARRASFNNAVKIHLKGHYIYKHPLDLVDTISHEITPSKKKPYRKEES